MTHSHKHRVGLYNQAHPDWPALSYDKRFALGAWMIGANYRSRSGYYGSYPPT